MTWWGWILLACLVAYLTKFVGHLVPHQTLEGPRTTSVMTGMTVGLLASLIALNTATSGTSLVLDARLVALAVGVVALLLRAPFLVVVVLATAACAGARLLGLP
ncbi:AzlD domain-containing protein [Aestuariimicrobium soli]|uniref:AzlD domain-containing protein n=1 Tax=Aestuariimicrobium soli TaxID=2035834 RepID=UPI003EBCA728